MLGPGNPGLLRLLRGLKILAGFFRVFSRLCHAVAPSSCCLLWQEAGMGAGSFGAVSWRHRIGRDWITVNRPEASCVGKQAGVRTGMSL